MKKASYVIAATLLVLCGVSTTSLGQSQTTFGIKGGVMLSNFYSGNTIDDQNVKPSFQGGFYLKAPIIEDVLYIQPELIYTRKGTEAEYKNILQGKGKYQFGLGYVELPVMLSVNIGHFNIHAGPYAAYLTDAKIKDVDSDGSVNGITDLKRSDFNAFDWGLAGGIGLDFGKAQVGLRYDLGMRPIGDSGILGNLTKDYKNSALQLYIGVNF